ncbi:hypothetical protein E4K72_19635 [Oxalobacteraceae bacterium OM1]|nr:hypothetical protein E4K72_19635 [Oxalobacteraceae bacterium OM1]
MKRIVVILGIAACLAGCAGPMPAGVQQTEAMTDMDGRPIAPGPAGVGGVGGVGVGIGVGSWGRHGGGGIGVGLGW